MQNTSQNSPNQNQQNAQNAQGGQNASAQRQGAQNPQSAQNAQSGQNAPRQASQGQTGANQPNQPNQANPDAMTLTPEEQRRAAQQTQRDESGMPGGGAGRTDVVGHTGVYPLSADEGASGGAKVQPEEAFGQGDRGAAGYQDSGGSAIIPPNELGKGDKEVI